MGDYLTQHTLGSGLVSARGATASLQAAFSRAEVNSRNPDAFLTWDEWSGVRALASERGRQLFSGVIWATDRPRTVREAVKRAAVLRGIAQARGLWCLSEPQLQVLRRVLGPRCPPVAHVRFGIDESFFTFTPPPMRPLVVSAGGDRDRDPRTLFDALARIHAARPDVAIKVQSTSTVRPPPGIEVVPRMAHTELRQLYRQASVVLIATKQNVHVSGMTVGLEAMATGRPVVMTATPGIEHYISDGSTGLLAAVGDAANLANLTLGLLDDPKQAAEMGRRGRSDVEASHTSRQMARSLAEFVNALA